MTRKTQKGEIPLNRSNRDGDLDVLETGGHNILRDKTFNRELRELINKIEGHESVVPAINSRTVEKKIPVLTESGIIRKLHSLHYRIDQMEDHVTVNSFFNPFSEGPDVGLFSENLMREEIGRGITRMGFESFAIMKFCVNDGCFRMQYNGIPILPEDNFIFGVNDPLYRRIAGNPWCTVLLKNDITAIPYFQKISDWTGFKDDQALIVFDTGKLLQSVYYEFGASEGYGQNSYIPSPLLLIYGNTEGIGNQPERVLNQLQSLVVMPLMFLLVRDQSQNQDLTTESFESLLEICIKLLFQKTEYCCVIVSSVPDKVENYFLMRFLYSKFLTIFKQDASILCMSPNRMIMFIKNKDILRVQAVTSQLNWDDEDFTIFQLKPGDFDNPSDMIKSLILNHKSVLRTE